MNFSKCAPAVIFLTVGGLAIPATASVIGNDSSVAASPDLTGITDSSNSVLAPVYASAYDFTSPMTDAMAPEAVISLVTAATASAPSSGLVAVEVVASNTDRASSSSGFAAASTFGFAPPTPEPSTILLAGCGLGVLAVFRRRRAGGKA